MTPDITPQLGSSYAGNDTALDPQTAESLRMLIAQHLSQQGGQAMPQIQPAPSMPSPQAQTPQMGQMGGQAGGVHPIIQAILGALATAGKAYGTAGMGPDERLQRDEMSARLAQAKAQMAMTQQWHEETVAERGQYHQGMVPIAQEKADTGRMSADVRADQGQQKLQQGQQGLDIKKQQANTQADLAAASEALKNSQQALADARTKSEPDKVRTATSAHQVALQNYQLARDKFERDTWGTVGGKEVPGTVETPGGAPTGWKAPLAPTSTTKTKAQQADAVIAGANQLIPVIRQNADKLGPFAGRATSLEQFIGNLPADSAELSALKSSFTSLLPGLHQFRSQGALKGFEKQLGTGSFKTNAEALEAAVRATAESARTMRQAWTTVQPSGKGQTVIPAEGAPAQGATHIWTPQGLQPVGGK
jgi:hypothetical protein